VTELDRPELALHNETVLARERHIATAALMSACTLSIVRAFLLPWLIKIAPPNTFPGMESQAIQTVSLCSAGLFFVLTLWATKEPLWPSIAALVFYAVMSMPDLLNQPGFLAKGIISKAVMSCVLLRALAAGLVHRTLISK
jgi:hypothetical protein